MIIFLGTLDRGASVPARWCWYQVLEDRNIPSAQTVTSLGTGTTASLSTPPHHVSSVVRLITR